MLAIIPSGIRTSLGFLDNLLILTLTRLRL